MLDEQGVPLPWGLLDRLYAEYDKTYQPRCLDSQGVLFRSDEVDGKRVVRARHDALAWENLFAQGLEIIPIPGDHYSIVREHRTIAREINRVLGQHWPGGDKNVSIEARKP